MAPITFTVITIDNKRFQVEADTEDTILQLAKKVSEVSKIDKDSFTLLPKGSTSYLTQHKSTTELRDIAPLINTDTLYLVRKPKRPETWRYNYNNRSIIDPNEKRYHTRILEESLARIRRNRQRRALAEVAEARELPQNVENIIGRYFGGKKTRKSKKSRKATRKTRRR